LFVPIFYSFRFHSNDELFQHKKPEHIKIQQLLDSDLPISIRNSEYSKAEISINHMAVHLPFANDQIPEEIFNIINLNQENEAPQPIMINENIENTEENRKKDEEIKKNFNAFILKIMIYTISMQIFLLLFMAFFIWNMSYIIIILYLAGIDLVLIELNLSPLRSFKFYL